MNQDELKTKDDRIHCVFYFIAAHRFREIDKAFILKLAKFVNIVPVIAKADSMTLEERRHFLCEVELELKKLSGELQYFPTYDFQEDDEDEDNEGNLAITNEDYQHNTNGVFRQKFLSTEEISATLADETLPSVFNIIGEELYAADSAQPKFGDHGRGSGGPPHDGAAGIGAHGDIKHYPTAAAANPSAFAYQLPCVKNIFAVVCDTHPSGFREYPWGRLKIDDEQHSDFRRLQKLVFEYGNCEYTYKPFVLNGYGLCCIP